MVYSYAGLLAQAFKEYQRTRNQANSNTAYHEFHSYHEGYGVLLEEVDELWEAIKNKNSDWEDLHKEIVQIMAMCIAFDKELGPNETPSPHFPPCLCGGQVTECYCSSRASGPYWNIPHLHCTRCNNVYDLCLNFGLVTRVIGDDYA